MKVYLVRHAQSESNVDKTVHYRVADPDIGVSDEGMTQPDPAGEFLFKNLQMDSPFPHVMMWQSPYKRTRMTGDILYPHIHDLVVDRRESVMLCEQSFGLFDGIPDEELPDKFPAEYAHYKKYEDSGMRFFAPMPLGERRMDVALRVHQFFGTLQRDRQKHDIDTVVIVAHGVTIRAFVMQWCHYDYEWFEAEPNPKNCSIRLIEGGEDKGYIFPGFPGPHTKPNWP